MATPSQIRATMPAGKSTNGDEDGIFGWYRYVQDFTAEFASQWITSLAEPGMLLWEPFSGSGTAQIAAKQLGVSSVGYDLNPFMVDVAKTKLDWGLDVRDLRRSLSALVKKCNSLAKNEPSDLERGSWTKYDDEAALDAANYPDDVKLARWISPLVLQRIQAVGRAIDRSPLRHQNFMRLALASTVVPASNMALRPNICYESRPILDFPVARSFAARLEKMYDDYLEVAGTSVVTAQVHLGDARHAGPDYADFIFTSPPYPNDMEYIHQTRLELALLNYVSNAKDLTRIKKQMISSSVKLVYRENAWQKSLGLRSSAVKRAYDSLALTLEGKNWGWNAADMVAQFYGGMTKVLENWKHRLRADGTAAVVIGDSAFNGVKVASDLILAEVAEGIGFEVKEIEVFRERHNSKHDVNLRESVVVLINRKPAT